MHSVSVARPDVYKRQFPKHRGHRQCSIRHFGLCRFANIGTQTDNPVSYTHLDVYKRQVVRAKEVFGKNRLTIISQRFHNERAIYLAEKNGIDAIGYNAPNVNAYAGLKTNIRELLARVKMFIDLGIDKQPHFLGEKIIIE